MKIPTEQEIHEAAKEKFPNPTFEHDCEFSDDFKPSEIKLLERLAFKAAIQWLISLQTDGEGETLRALREVGMRGQYLFPENEQDLEWHEQGFNGGQGKLFSYINQVLKLGIINEEPAPTQPVSEGEEFEKWAVKNGWRKINEDNYGHEYRTWGGFPVSKRAKDLHDEWLQTQPIPSKPEPKVNMTEDYRKGYADGFKEATDYPSKPEWVSVDDKLPEDKERVLILKSSGQIKEGGFLKQDQWGRENQFIINGAYYDIIKWITHWMPLPPIPTDQKYISENNELLGNNGPKSAKSEINDGLPKQPEGEDKDYTELSKAYIQALYEIERLRAKQHTGDRDLERAWNAGIRGEALKYNREAKWITFEDWLKKFRAEK